MPASTFLLPTWVVPWQGGLQTAPVAEPALQCQCQTFPCNGPTHPPFRNLSQGIVRPSLWAFLCWYLFMQLPQGREVAFSIQAFLHHFSPCSPRRPSSGLGTVAAVLRCWRRRRPGIRVQASCFQAELGTKSQGDPRSDFPVTSCKIQI